MPTHTPLSGYSYFSDLVHCDHAERNAMLELLKSLGITDKAPLAISFYRRLKERNYRLRTPTGQNTILRLAFLEVALAHYLQGKTKSPHINYYPAIEECIAEIKAQPELYPAVNWKPERPVKKNAARTLKLRGKALV